MLLEASAVQRSITPSLAHLNRSANITLGRFLKKADRVSTLDTNHPLLHQLSQRDEVYHMLYRVPCLH